MRRLLISAAALALFAAPALAQQDQPAHGYGHHFDQALQAKQGAQHAQQPARAPQPQGGRVEHGGNRGGAPAHQASPAAQAQGGPQLWGHQPDQGQNNNARGNTNRGGNDNRGYRDNGRGNDRGGMGSTNRGYGNPGYAGQRHDFSNFRQFHRSFNASRRFRGPDYRRPSGWYEHRWSFGEFLPRAFWARDYWLVDFAAYDLPPPPYGAVWVRVGNDALLVDEDSGEVITVEYGVFY